MGVVYGWIVNVWGRGGLGGLAYRCGLLSWWVVMCRGSLADVLWLGLTLRRYL